VLGLKSAWADGTSHVVVEPLDFLARLAALTPRPRVNPVLWNRRSPLTPAERAQQPPLNPAAGDILCLVEVPAECRGPGGVRGGRRAGREGAGGDRVARGALRQQRVAADAGALQESPKRAGLDPGRADGRVDDRTLNAAREFQRSKGLPMDNDRCINMATVKALGVAP
jgi:hypothetical protein